MDGSKRAAIVAAVNTYLMVEKEAAVAASPPMLRLPMNYWGLAGMLELMRARTPWGVEDWDGRKCPSNDPARNHPYVPVVIPLTWPRDLENLRRYIGSRL